MHDKISLRKLSVSPLVSRTFLLWFRAAALLVHAAVIILGLYTRRMVFFIQFTNITNIISTVYFYLAVTASHRYCALLAVQNKTNQTISVKNEIEYTRKAPSTMAETARVVLSLATSMHLLVTVMFWLFVVHEFIVETVVDWVYAILAHGVTLVFVLFEVMFTNVTFPLSNIRYIFLITVLYLLLALAVYQSTGYLVYWILDYHNPFNVKCIYPIIIGAPILLYFLGSFLALLRESIVESSNTRFQKRELVPLYKSIAASAASAALVMIATKHNKQEAIYGGVAVAVASTIGIAAHEIRQRRRGSASLGNLDGKYSDATSDSDSASMH